MRFDSHFHEFFDRARTLIAVNLLMVLDQLWHFVRHLHGVNKQESPSQLGQSCDSHQEGYRDTRLNMLRQIFQLLSKTIVLT